MKSLTLSVTSALQQLLRLPYSVPGPVVGTAQSRPGPFLGVSHSVLEKDFHQKKHTYVYIYNCYCVLKEAFRAVCMCKWWRLYPVEIHLSRIRSLTLSISRCSLIYSSQGLPLFLLLPSSGEAIAFRITARENGFQVVPRWIHIRTGKSESIPSHFY